MNVLLINGSPRPKGCTFTALTEVAKSLENHGISTNIVQIGTQAIRGCIACNKCVQTGYCIFKDDPVNEFVDLLKASDGVVVGSPVYYASPNASVCALLDRMFYHKSAAFAFKPAATLVSCRRAGSSATLDDLNKYFQFAQMPLVSSHYWHMVHGNSPEEVAQDIEGLQIMRILGNNMAWLIKSLAAAKDTVPFPIQEKRVLTNFIR